MPLEEQALQRIRQRVGTTVQAAYRLERLLGIGGSAAVFEATHTNGNRVALKVLHPEFAKLPQVRTRFLREGYVANRIAHSGVARILDDGDDDAAKTVFLVIELLEGETVETRRRRLGGRLPPAEVLDYADRVLDVLAIAHDAGIVHRDMKGENVFLTVHGQLKVLDFGIARLLDGTGATSSGHLLGTPAFMAPEQAAGRIREIDGRADLWSVGALIFTLLTGAPVHEANTPLEHVVRAATVPVRPIESLAPWLGRDPSFAVNRALAFNRDMRWPNARDMQAAFRQAADGGPSLAPAGRPIAAPIPNSALAPTVDMPGPVGTVRLPRSGNDSR